MKNSSLTNHAAFVGGAVVILYVVCLLWRYTMTDPEVMRFHLLSLKATFPGFTGYTAGSMLWGAVLSFVYGFVASALFHMAHKNCVCSRKK